MALHSRYLVILLKVHIVGIAFLKFEEAVQEIFAVALLPGMRFPDLINDDAELVGSSFVLPDDALRDVPVELRSGV